MGKRGFTLVELTVVIAILAILAGIAVPSMLGYRDKAAEGVNRVNLLTTQRQLRMLWDNAREEFREVPDRLLAEEEGFTIGSWQISAPKALGVRSGDAPVEEGTAMRAWLDENQDWTTSYLDGGENPGQEAEVDAPAESVPETTQAPEPTVSAHAHRDRDGDCLCDVEGCQEPQHDDGNVDDGNCEKCGTHFRHVGTEDQVCNECGWDETTGQIHVCSWAQGECRCRCGASRCSHGGAAGMGRCSYCGNSNYPMMPCANCN